MKRNNKKYWKVTLDNQSIGYVFQAKDGVNTSPEWVGYCTRTGTLHGTRDSKADAIRLVKEVHRRD